MKTKRYFTAVLKPFFAWCWGGVLMALTSALLLSSCSQDEQTPQIAVGQSELSVNLNIPYGNTDALSTYSMPEDESKLEHMAVLAFKTDPAYPNDITKGTFLYKSLATIKKNGAGCVFKVRSMADPQTFVFIANARQAVDDAILQEGITSKEQAIQNVLMTRAFQTGFDGSVMTSIPMWGEAQNIVVNGDKTSIPQVSLYHSMAKINVKTDAAGKVPPDLFELKQVYVYMPRINGTVIPGNWGTYTGSLPGEPNVAVSTPTEPTVTGTIPARGTKYPVYATSSNEVKDRIFVFEAKNRPGVTMLDRTCLVVGGSYKGSATNYYYRIDLAKADGTQLDILRNFIYNIRITGVNGKGYEEANDAYKSVSMNIEFEIADWNDGGMTNTEIDGNKYLNVNQSVFNLDKPQYTASNTENTLIIKTNVSNGWKATLHGDAACSTTPPAWISLDKNSSSTASPDTGDEVHILLTENNTATSPRMAWIKIACGRMNKIIRVEQTNELALQITPESLFEFPSGRGNAQSLRGKERTFEVVWSPAANDIDISVVKGSTATDMFSFDNYNGKDNIIDGSQLSGATYAGRKTYKILPTTITEFEISKAGGFMERTSEIQYTLTIGSTKITRTVCLKQVHYNVVAADIQKFYNVKDKQFTIHIRSNAKWKIKDIKENQKLGTNLLGSKAGDNLAVNLTGGPNMQNGDALVFTTTNATGYQAGEVEVKFESTDNPKKFDDITIKISIDTRTWFNGHSGWAGSNIYWDGRKLTFDDVGVTTHSEYQGVFFKWGSLYGISPDRNEPNYYDPKGLTVYTPSGTVQKGTKWDSLEGVPDGILPNKVDESKYHYCPPGMQDESRVYLYDITDGNTGLGDICKYMTEKGWAPAGKWRMPSASEYLALNENSSFAKWSPTRRDYYHSESTDGQGITRYGEAFSIGQSPSAYLWLPASNCRTMEGMVQDYPAEGRYWTSSSIREYRYNAYIREYNNIPRYYVFTSSYSGNYGFPVRCVRE